MRELFHACGLVVYLGMIFLDANEHIAKLAEVISKMGESIAPLMILFTG